MLEQNIAIPLTFDSREELSYYSILLNDLDKRSDMSDNSGESERECGGDR